MATVRSGATLKGGVLTTASWHSVGTKHLATTVQNWFWLSAKVQVAVYVPGLALVRVSP